MQDGLVILTVLICLITDFKKRKIYNGVLVPALLVSLIINVFLNGWSGFLVSAQGFLFGLGLLLLPFILGGIGAGDVKLLATIGAIKGPYFVFSTFLGMGVTGGVIAISILIYQRRFLKTLMEIGKGFWMLFITNFKVVSFGGNDNENMFPYGIAITLGVLSAYVVG